MELLVESDGDLRLGLLPPLSILFSKSIPAPIRRFEEKKSLEDNLFRYVSGKVNILSYLLVVDCNHNQR